jgi:chromosomal replication initiator protein
VTSAEIKGASRMKEIAVARQVAIYVVREITRQSFPCIGDVFGKKHSTIIHAYNKIREDIDKDSSLANRVSDLMGRLT